MNDGKICVPVCAGSVDEFVKDIERAAEYADVIELRFDYLSPEEFDLTDIEGSGAVMTRILENNHGKEFLSTFRTKEQGGARNITQNEREHFWDAGFDVGGADCEEDMIENSFYWLWDYRICSFHDFRGVPENLESIYKRLRGTNADIVKIAAQTDDITDGLPLWQLLKRAAARAFIPVAMGEAGKWMRIMAPAYGSPLTYASLETGKETAPGQITAREMAEVYRVKELTKDTLVYAIIGDPVARSLSPYMHNDAFKLRGIDAVFMHMEVKDLDRFMREFVPGSGLNFGGFAVTMPHKETIIPYLDELDETAKATGAVNTVKFDDGKLIGLNTDIYGIVEPLKSTFGDLKDVNIAVLGSGGAARACVYALTSEGADVEVYARNFKKAEKIGTEFGINADVIHELVPDGFDIVINATSVGMKEGDRALKSAIELNGTRLVFDLITRPAETPLLLEAKKAGVPTIGGVEMLIAQGVKQFEIWTGQDAPVDVMRNAAVERL